MLMRVGNPLERIGWRVVEIIRWCCAVIEHCIATLLEEKRFSLAFPEGKCFVGIGKILSSKSRSLGVSPALKSMDEPFAISK